MMSAPCCDTRPILAQTSFPNSHCQLCARSRQICVETQNPATSRAAAATRCSENGLSLHCPKGAKFCKSDLYTTLRESLKKKNQPEEPSARLPHSWGLAPSKNTPKASRMRAFRMAATLHRGHVPVCSMRPYLQLGIAAPGDSTVHSATEEANSFSRLDLVYFLLP